MKKGQTEGNIEEVDQTHQLDTGTQAGGVNLKTDEKPHWTNTSMTTNTDQGKKMNHKKTT